MKLHIKNLGPIKEATIDLSKRFYTFVGYNNTGKTYLTHLLDCVFNPISYLKNGTSSELFKGNFLEWNELQSEIMLQKMADMIKKEAFPKTLNIVENHFIIENCAISFALDLNEIKRLEWKFQVHYYKNGMAELAIIEKPANSLSFQWDIDGYFIEEVLYEGIHNQIRRQVLFLQNPNIYHYYQPPLPTERLSFMYFYKYFFRIEKERREEINRYIQSQNGKELDRKALTELSASNYTQASGNLLEGLYNLNSKRSEQPYYQDFALKLMEIMQGKIVLSTSNANGDTNFHFEIAAIKEQLDLYLASSSVNQLSALYLYWKYWVGEDNNFLMIDEPEQNLHPENQVKLTELLIQFANTKNNRVLICTHTPFITEVINNYLVLGQLENREEAREKLGLAENCFLTPEDTGIYFFTGDRVREYKISDYGTIFEDFKAAQEKVWDIGYELGELMYEQIKKKINAEN